MFLHVSFCVDAFGCRNNEDILPEDKEYRKRTFVISRTCSH